MAHEIRNSTNNSSQIKVKKTDSNTSNSSRQVSSPLTSFISISNSSQFDVEKTDSNLSNSSQKVSSPNATKPIQSKPRATESKALNNSTSGNSPRASLESRLSNNSKKTQSPRVQQSPTQYGRKSIHSETQVSNSQSPRVQQSKTESGRQSNHFETQVSNKQSPRIQPSQTQSGRTSNNFDSRLCLCPKGSNSSSQTIQSSPKAAGGIRFSQSYYPGTGSPKERFIAACCADYKQPSPKRGSSAESVGEESTITAYVPRHYYVNTGHIRQRLAVKFPSGVNVSNLTGITACQPPRVPVPTCLPAVPIRVPSMHSVLIKGTANGLDLCSLQQLREPCPPRPPCGGALEDFQCSCTLVDPRCGSCDTKHSSNCSHAKSNSCGKEEGEEETPHAYSVQCIPLEIQCTAACKLRWVVVVVMYAVTFVALLIIMCVNCKGTISVVMGVVLLAVLSAYDGLQARDAVHTLPPRDADLIQRLRTGRTALLGDLKKAGLVACARCPCRAAEESAGHVLQECRRYAAQREAAWPCGGDLHSKLYGSAEQLQRTARFFDDTGLRVRLDNRVAGECCR